ncbi:hypothetical protein [Schumannella soli]|uniref:Uncharacterized protein n=1 Tax=Schumannella soli TaxID=2590779 RepID=A0A506XXL8_9MICO|nr:hypothetical protein [Schumannella soli]TPW77644.1 hypothetical protein FJ657_03000 [Schumannella soli]
MSATELTSTILGPIRLDGGSGGGWMETRVDLDGASVPLRLEVDHPDRFGEQLVFIIDIALTGLAEIEKMARGAIESELGQSGTAADKLFTAWRQSGFRRREDPNEFLADLSVTQIILLPDGGADQLDRMVFTYRLPDTPAPWKVVVRMKDRVGPVIDPAPRGGFV